MMLKIHFRIHFNRLKQAHTLVGVSVTSSQLSLFNGEQLGLKVQSMWMKEGRRKFYFYYGMTIAKFRERCYDMHHSRTYKIHDLSIYQDEKGQVQVAAVWHNAPP